MANLTGVTKYYPVAKEGFTTTLSSTAASGATTVNLNSVTGYSNGDVVVLTVDPGNSSKQVLTGIVDTSGVRITSVKWTEGTNVSHINGATVSDYVTATHFDMHSTAALVEHDQAGRLVDRINVKSYGATGDGTTDDTSAIQSAIAAASTGQTVFFPRGTYIVSSPIIIPPGITIRGTHANHTDNVGSNWTAIGSWIKGKSTFAGTGIIKMVDKEIGSYSKDSCEQRIFNINIDGTDVTDVTTNGIHAYGLVHGVVMRDICIKNSPARGIYTQAYTRADTSVVNPYSWRMTRVLVDTTVSYGYSLNNFTDSTLVDVESINAGGSGWFISGCGNSHFTNCRAEWSTENGFYIDAGGNYNAVMFTSCSTDSNENHGVYVTGTGTQPVYFNGIMNHRDGRNGGTGGGGYAGLFVDTVTAPVIVDGVSVSCGVDDDGTGTTHPQYGFKASGATYCSVNSGFLHGNTAGWLDDGTNTILRRGPNIVEQTGTWNSPTTVTDTPTRFMTGAATEDIMKSKVSADTNSRFSVDAKGLHSWGPGNAATDTTLYRSGVGILKTDGTFQPSILDAGTGIKINSAATTGHVLRGNGTNFVDAALAASDLSDGVSGSGAVALATGPTITLASASTAVTQSGRDNSTKVASTAYVDRNIYLPHIMSYKEDFTEGTSVSVTTSQGLVFETGWHGIQISGGTQTIAAQAGTFTNPGQALMTTSATSGQGVVIWRSGPGAGAAPLGALGSNANWEMHYLLKLNATTNVCIRFGACIAGQHTGDAPTNGIYFEYDTANTGNTDSKFTGVCRSASTSTYVTTNQIAADTSFHHFRIRSTNAGTILFSVDGGTEDSIATNVPTGALGPMIQLITRTAGAANAVVDFTSYAATTGRT